MDEIKLFLRTQWKLLISLLIGVLISYNIVNIYKIGFGWPFIAITFGCVLVLYIIIYLITRKIKAYKKSDKKGEMFKEDANKVKDGFVFFCMFIYAFWKYLLAIGLGIWTALVLLQLFKVKNNTMLFVIAIIIAILGWLLMIILIVNKIKTYIKAEKPRKEIFSEDMNKIKKFISSMVWFIKKFWILLLLLICIIAGLIIIKFFPIGG